MSIGESKKNGKLERRLYGESGKQNPSTFGIQQPESRKHKASQGDREKESSYQGLMSYTISGKKLHQGS